MKTHPCLTCGACCAYFRVSFYWAESLPDSFHVPEDLIEIVTPQLVAMKRDANNRCVALKGEVGKESLCSIYEKRSSSCRDFIASFENGEHNELCDRARAKFNLPPLTQDHWRD